MDDGVAVKESLAADVDMTVGDVFEAGYSSFNDTDTSPEVDAAFRSQRRIAVGYFLLFLVGVLGVAIGTVWSGWATNGRVFGGFSPSFLMTAIGLYLFFVVVGVAAATLANTVDERMLGATSVPRPDRDQASSTTRGGR